MSTASRRDKIDEAALKFGMPMGPIELMDLVGLDIANHVGEELNLAPESRQRARAPRQAGQARQEDGRGLLCLEGRQAEARRGRPTTRPSSSALGRELVEPMIDEAERCARRPGRRKRRSRRCRRDLRHGLRAVPRRPAALSAHAEGRHVRAPRPRHEPARESSHHDGSSGCRRVAVLGGIADSLLPLQHGLCRALQSRHADAALGGLVDRFTLHGAHIDEVVGGAVVTHAKDWNLAREAVIGSALAPTTPGITMMQACGTSLQGALKLGAKIATGQIECGIALGSDTTSDAPIVFKRSFAQRLVQASRAKRPRREARGLQGLHAGRARAAAALDRRAAHGAQHGRALRADGQGMGHHPRGAGPARL